MIAILLAIIVSIAAGAASERRWGEDSRRAGRAILTTMLFALVPFESFFNIAHLHLSAGVGAGIGLAYLVLAIVGISGWVIARRLLALTPASSATFVCTVMVANTAYLGLPLVSALLGQSQLPTAVAYDTLVGGPILLFVGFGLGAAFGTRAGTGTRQRTKAFLARNPPLLAVIAGLAAPASFAPAIMVSAAHVVVYALLPLGFYVLGVNLASAAQRGLLSLSEDMRAPVMSAIALRMLLVPALLSGFSPLVGLPHAYLLQSAMPSGINTLIVVQAYGLDLRLASTTIAWSTLVAVVAVIVTTILI